MTKTKTARKNITILLLAIIPVVGVFAHYTASGSAQSVQQLQQQIDSLKEEISGSEARIQELREREDTLENRLEILEAEIAQAEDELAKTKQEISATKQKIRETKQKIERLKDQMQENAKIIYKNGDPSTIEVLFSSDNFTDFINRQEYLERAKKNLNEASNEAKELQASLKNEKKELETLQAKQEGQRREIASRISEQENLLVKTRGEEKRYQQLVSEQRSEKKRLQEQQRQAYAAAAAAARNSNQFVSIGGSGSYPWAHKPAPCHSSSCVDPWGLYYNECVSYVAWKLDSEGKMVQHFGGAGNANEWPSSTSHYTNRLSSPKVGAAAVDDSIQPYGHIMYVEQVFAGGSKVKISEYNFEGPGVYSERIISSRGLTFLEFPSR